MIDTRVALLQVLVSGEGYGLELIERIKTSTGGKIIALQGRVYPALRELEAEGLVKSWEGEPIAERGGRPRRYYKLTAEGRRAATSNQKAVVGLFAYGGVTA